MPNKTDNTSPDNAKLVSIVPYSIETPASTEESGWSLAPILEAARRRAVVMIGVGVSVSALSWFFAFSQKPQYSSNFQLLVEPVTQGQNLPDVTGNGERRDATLDYQSQIQVLRSPQLLEPIVQKIQAQYPNYTYGALATQLSVIQPPQTKIIQVSYTDSDAQRVKFVLDRVAEGYLRYSQQERQSNLRQGVEFINDQIKKTQNRVDGLQRQLQNFRQQGTLVDPQAKSSQVDAQLAALEQQALEVGRQMAEIQQTYNSLAAQSGTRAALAASASYQQMLGQLQELERRIAIESVRFLGDDPTLQALQNQKANLMPLLRDEARRVLGDRLAEIENQIAVLRVRQAAIQNATQYWQQQAQALPIASRQFTDLQRELGVATGSLNRSLQLREALQVEVAQKTVAWQIISPPAQAQIPQTSTLRNLILGALTGVLAAVAVAFVLEKLDNTFRSSSDLKKSIKHPVLGMIPYYPSLYDSPDWETMFTRSSSSNSSIQFMFVEAFRSLNVRLRRLGSDLPKRSIVISSAQPGDGKSTIALFLAQAAAAMGQRVLLVDADLRSPQISNLLGFDAVPGLSDLIANHLDAKQLLQSIPLHSLDDVMPNSTLGADAQFQLRHRGRLYVLPSGLLALEPTELLASREMQSLMETWQTKFDLIIYDTPPVLNLADSHLLAAQADGCLLVANIGQTMRSSILEAIETLESANVPVLGIVANGVRGQSYGTAQRYADRVTSEPALASSENNSSRNGVNGN